MKPSSNRHLKGGTPFPKIPWQWLLAVVALALPLFCGCSNGAFLDSTLSSCSCTANQLMKDCCCNFGTIEKVHDDLTPVVRDLVRTTFFHYYKVNLHAKCPFWDDEAHCFLRDCSVKECSEEEIPACWKQSLHEITLPKVVFQPFVKECEYSEKDFCVVEGPQSEGTYVNLLDNPEAFTGYSGPTASRIWDSIYKENCFTQGSTPGSEVCTEKRVFYRLISGLHASIGVHLSMKYYDQTIDQWIVNTTLFEERVMNHPEWVENLYFAYVVTLRAITKIADYLLEYDFSTGDPTMDKYTEELINFISTYSMTCPKTFDEGAMFLSDGAETLKIEVRDSFRNISRIMDCVSCEKCRLWGKIQTTGLGTALKVLFSYDENPLKNFDYNLKRNEIVALFNTFSALTESIHYVREYQDKMHKASALAHKKHLTAIRGVLQLISNLPAQVYLAGAVVLALTSIVIFAWRCQGATPPHKTKKQE